MAKKKAKAAPKSGRSGVSGKKSSAAAGTAPTPQSRQSDPSSSAPSSSAPSPASQSGLTKEAGFCAGDRVRVSAQTNCWAGQLGTVHCVNAGNGYELVNVTLDSKPDAGPKAFYPSELVKL